MRDTVAVRSTNAMSVSPLTAHLGYWMRQVSNHVSQAFARKLEAEGVTVAEWVVLRELHDGPLAPSSVAERLGMTRGGITKLADRLIGQALVVRLADREDGRAQRLSLTAAGRKLVPRLAALADANDAEFFGQLTPRDRQLLSRVLQELVARHRLETVPIS